MQPGRTFCFREEEPVLEEGPVRQKGKRLTMQKNNKGTNFALQKGQTFSFHIHNFGCKLNSYESDALAQFFVRCGGKEVFAYKEAELILFNSCTVTREAGRKAGQALRKARKENKEALLVVMGCHSQLEDMSGTADLCGGTSQRLELAKEALRLMFERREKKHYDGVKGKQKCREKEPCFRKRIPTYEELGPVLRQSEIRAKVKIADGCEEFCSYCAICLARGKVRSRAREDILHEAKSLAERGHKEIILTATNITAFESDLGHSVLALAELIEALSAIKELKRIRLGSLEPQALTFEFIERISKIEKLCPHFHISLQSASDAVLRKMGRNYTAAHYRNLLEALKAGIPRATITTDIMVGFPEESEEDFKATYEFAEEMAFARIHVFRFSPRKDTKAAKMPQIASDVSRRRSEIMQGLAAELAGQNNAKVLGQEVEIILETERMGLAPAAFHIDKAGPCYTGYSAEYLPALIFFSEGAMAKSGDLWKARVEYTDGEYLYLLPIERID